MSICQIYDLCAETLWLGRYGENGARDIAIDVGRWFADLGAEGTVVLVNWRPGEDDTPYNPNVTMDGSKVVWSPSSIDLAISGRGFAELRYYVGNSLAKSKTFRTVIDRTPSEGANPPSAAEDWVERMEDAAVTAQTASDTAVAAAETATEGAQAVAQALPTITQAAQTATSAAATATSAATEAALSEEVASAAANAARTASETATAASQTAVSSASTATTKATQAVGAAGTATTKASEAAQAATTATEGAQTSTFKAGEATTAAATATSKATEATTAASTASAAATTATSAASTATSEATTATAAKTAAETAQTGAETAQAAAESAAASVTASAEQIETNKQDITELKADLLQKANIDGAYSDLTAGNAEQLVSTVYEEDSVPYIFRTAGGSMDIGDREEDMLVGGSIAWNQLAPELAIANYTFNNSTAVIQDGVIRVIPNNAGLQYNFGISNAIAQDAKIGHKYLIHEDIKITTNGQKQNYAITLNFSGYIYPSLTIGAFTSVTAIFNCSTDTYKARLLNYPIGPSGRAESVNDTVDVKNINIIDLTQMFGSTIADYIYSLEQANAGAGVAWFRKLFPKDYYAYNAGSMLHVEGVSAHETVGFNAWDEEWEVGAYSSSDGQKTGFISDRIRSKNFIPVLPNTTYYHNKGLQIYFYDADKNYIYWENSSNASTFTTRANAHYITFNGLANSGATYNHDICINLSWDGERDGEYEPYVKHSYPLDSSIVLRGIPKLDSANNLYYDGDTYESDGTVTRRYGVVDLGTLSWAHNGENKVYASIASKKIGSQNIITDNFTRVPATTDTGAMANGQIKAYADSQSITLFLTGINAGNASTMLSGKYLVYELATPTAETAEPYQNPQIVDDFGTEEYVTTGIVPVGHVTKYQPNLRAKLEMSPDSPDGDGDYIVRQSNGENSYVSLASTATIQDILARLTALEGNTNEG